MAYSVPPPMWHSAFASLPRHMLAMVQPTVLREPYRSGLTGNWSLLCTTVTQAIRHFVRHAHAAPFRWVVNTISVNDMIYIIVVLVETLNVAGIYNLGKMLTAPEPFRTSVQNIVNAERVLRAAVRAGSYALVDWICGTTFETITLDCHRLDLWYNGYDQIIDQLPNIWSPDNIFVYAARKPNVQVLSRDFVRLYSIAGDRIQHVVNMLNVAHVLWSYGDFMEAFPLIRQAGRRVHTDTQFATELAWYCNWAGHKLMLKRALDWTIPRDSTLCGDIIRPSIHHNHRPSIHHNHRSKYMPSSLASVNQPPNPQCEICEQVFKNVHWLISAGVKPNGIDAVLAEQLGCPVLCKLIWSYSQPGCGI